MHLILPIFSTIVGLVATLMLVTMLLAGSANSTPQQLAAIKAWMITALVVGAAGAIGAVWLMVVGRPMPAAAAGAGPVVFCIAAGVYLFITQSE